ncbi:MAG: SRPBCC family protein [Methyloligellaceae bacterium]
MRLAHHTIIIRAPVSEVFDYLINHENYVNWYPNVVSVVSINELLHGTPGKEYREIIKVPVSREADLIIKVIECEENERFVTESNWSPLFPRMEVVFTRLSHNETSLTWSLFSRNGNFLSAFLIRLLLKRTINKSSYSGLQKLKAILESNL